MQEGENAAGGDPACLGCCALLCCGCAERHANTLRWRCCRRRCNVGPHWAFNLFAWALILGLTLAFLVFVGSRLHWGVVVADVCTCLALAGAFGATTLFDAGFLDRQTPAQLAAQKAGILEAAAKARAGGGAGSSTGASSAAEIAAVDVRGEDGSGGGGGGGSGGGGGVLQLRADVVGAQDPLLAYTTCSICNVLRERGTTHCSDCGLCVRELDHHCPWSGKCIGAGNIAPFRAFLGLLLLHAALTGM
jgi:hypothetical protein